MKLNLVEMLADDCRQAPCKHGNIVAGHACYCHHDRGPRKCPVWRQHGEQQDKWHADIGGCALFEPRDPTPADG